MHSSRTCTACSSSHHGGSPHTPQEQAPPARSPSTPPLGVGLDQIPLNFPIGCGPGPDPPQLPLGCGPGDPLWPDPPKLPPWVWAWKPTRHAGIPPHGDLLQGMLGYHPPMDRILDTRFWKYYLAPNFVCGRLKLD